MLLISCNVENNKFLSCEGNYDLSIGQKLEKNVRSNLTLSIRDNSVSIKSIPLLSGDFKICDESADTIEFKSNCELAKMQNKLEKISTPIIGGELNKINGNLELFNWIGGYKEMDWNSVRGQFICHHSTKIL
jgi:hypothetical protein